jgi:hypothetical protein
MKGDAVLERLTRHGKNARLAYRQRHRALGLCSDCSRPAAPGRSMCQLHLDTNNQRARDTYRFYKSMGVDKRKVGA